MWVVNRRVQVFYCIVLGKALWPSMFQSMWSGGNPWAGLSIQTTTFVPSVSSQLAVCDPPIVFVFVIYYNVCFRLVSCTWSKDLNLPWCWKMFNRQIFWQGLGVLHSRNPPNGPPKINFWTAQARVPVFFCINRYLRDKYLDIVWGHHTPGDPPNGLPKSIFWRAQLMMPDFFISVDI